MKSDELKDRLRSRSIMRNALLDAMVNYLCNTRDQEGESAVAYLTSGGKLPRRYLSVPSISKIYNEVRGKFPDSNFEDACTTKNDDGTA